MSLMIADVLFPNVKFTTYNNIVYLGLKPNATAMLHNVPTVEIRLPVRDRSETPKSSKRRSNQKEDDSKWISSKKKAAPKRKNKRSTRKSTPSKCKTSLEKANRVSDSSHEVINILDDSSDEESDECGGGEGEKAKCQIQGFLKRSKLSNNAGILLDDLESDSSENEFE